MEPAPEHVGDDGQPATGPATGPATRVEPDDLEAALARRTPSRWRLARAALLAGALLIALGVVVSNLPRATGTAPMPVTPQVVSTLLVASNVSYGSVTLNGVRLAGDALPVQVKRLAFGPNTIELSAPPFVPVRCTVVSLVNTLMVQPGYAGRCSITLESAGVQTVHTNINVLLTGSDLPPALLERAQQAVAQALAKVTLGAAIVPVGQYYATDARGPGAISVHQATEPLNATLTMVPAPASDDVFPTDAGATLDRCENLGCPLPPHSVATIAPHGWIVGDTLALDWRFTTRAGALVGEARYEVGEYPMSFVVPTGANDWVLTTDFETTDFEAPGGLNTSPPDVCMVGSQALMQYPALRGASVNEQLRSESASGIQGCEIVAVVPGSRPALYVWRFGALLVADAVARQLTPDLPVAPPAEAQLVGA